MPSSNQSLSLTPDQIKAITAFANASPPNYPGMYSFIANEMRSGRIEGATSDQVYWFEQAARINAGDASSPASVFIREATVQGLTANGQPASKEVIDRISNAIGANVARDILSDGSIPPFTKQLNADIAGAIQAGNMTIGGWGGAFYYWNYEWTDSNGNRTTVGQSILSDPNERDKFIKGNAAAIATVLDSFSFGELAFNASNRAATWDAFVRGIENIRLTPGQPGGLPAGDIAGQIIDRVQSSVMNRGGLFMQELIDALSRASGATPPSKLPFVGFSATSDADAIANALAGDLTQIRVAGEGQPPDMDFFAQVQQSVVAELAGRDLTGATVYRNVGGLYVVMLPSGENIRVNASGQVASTRTDVFDDGSAITTNRSFDRNVVTNTVDINGVIDIRRFDGQGLPLSRETITPLPAGSRRDVYNAAGEIDYTVSQQRSGDQLIEVLGNRDGSEVRTITDANTGQIISRTGTAAPLQSFGTALQDLNSLAGAIRSGQPLPILNSGLTLIDNQVNPTIGGTQTFNNMPLYTTTAVVSAATSLYSLHNAFSGEGTDVQRFTATANAIVAFNTAANAVASEIAGTVINNVAGEVLTGVAGGISTAL